MKNYFLNLNNGFANEELNSFNSFVKKLND